MLAAPSVRGMQVSQPGQMAGDVPDQAQRHCPGASKSGTVPSKPSRKNPVSTGLVSPFCSTGLSSFPRGKCAALSHTGCLCGHGLFGQPDANACALFQFLFLSEVLQWRAQTTPDHVLYTLLNCRVRPVARHSGAAFSSSHYILSLQCYVASFAFICCLFTRF